MSRQNAADAEDTGEIPIPEAFKERRRSGWRLQELGVMVMLLVQLAGLIWGAATLKSGVDNMQGIVSELKDQVRAVDGRQRQQEIEAAEQKGRLQAIQDMVFDLRSRILK